MIRSTRKSFLWMRNGWPFARRGCADANAASKHGCRGSSIGPGRSLQQWIRTGDRAIVEQRLLHHLPELQGFSYGPGRDRTCDLGIKSPLLYRLSYRPRAASGPAKQGYSVSIRRDVPPADPRCDHRPRGGRGDRVRGLVDRRARAARAVRALQDHDRRRLVGDHGLQPRGRDRGVRADPVRGTLPAWRGRRRAGGLPRCVDRVRPRVEPAGAAHVPLHPGARGCAAALRRASRAPLADRIRSPRRRRLGLGRGDRRRGRARARRSADPALRLAGDLLRPGAGRGPRAVRRVPPAGEGSPAPPPRAPAAPDGQRRAPVPVRVDRRRALPLRAAGRDGVAVLSDRGRPRRQRPAARRAGRAAARALGSRSCRASSRARC